VFSRSSISPADRMETDGEFCVRVAAFGAICVSAPMRMAMYDKTVVGGIRHRTHMVAKIMVLVSLLHSRRCVKGVKSCLAFTFSCVKCPRVIRGRRHANFGSEV
jgi:hypothetical protein